MNAFAILGLEPRASLAEEEVRAAFFQLSKQGDADREALNAAFELLIAPEKRLKHLIDIAAPEDAKQWRTVSMSEDLMDIFMKLGRVRPEAEAVIEKRTRAQSALSKALLEPQTFALREQLEEIGFALNERREELLAALAGVNDWRAIAEAQARFAYLEKWQTQVRELLMKLM